MAKNMRRLYWFLYNPTFFPDVLPWRIVNLSISEQVVKLSISEQIGASLVLNIRSNFLVLCSGDLLWCQTIYRFEYKSEDCNTMGKMLKDLVEGLEAKIRSQVTLKWCSLASFACVLAVQVDSQIDWQYLEPSRRGCFIQIENVMILNFS